MRNFLLFLLILVVAVALTLRMRYGGGEPYPDLTTAPLIAETRIETVLNYPEPIGNVAVSAEGRVFFTVHPEARPRGNKVLEWAGGAAVPYPSGTVQPHLFDTPLGIKVDRQNRLWTIDHGNHGFRTARLLAFNLTNGEVVHDQELTPEIAPAGSLLQDLVITPNGDTVVIADASVWGKSPALIVYDIATRKGRRVLENHPSVTAEDYLVRTAAKDMKFLGGLVSLKTGVDGIVIDRSGTWLYYGAINQSGLYRVPVEQLRNPTLPARELEGHVDRFSDKPLSDGLDIDATGRVYVTDVEHGAVVVVDQARRLTTLVRSPRIRWADSLSFGPDGWLYIADSALHDVILQTPDHIAIAGPYYVFRVRPEQAGLAIQ